MFILKSKKLLLLMLLMIMFSSLFILSSAENFKEKQETISFAELEFPYALPDKKIIIKRVIDNNGNIVTVSNNNEYKSLKDILELKELDKRIRKEKYGALVPSLITKYEEMSETEKMEVLVAFYDNVNEETVKNFSNAGVKKVDTRSYMITVSKKELNHLMLNSLVKQISLKPVKMSGGDEWVPPGDPADYYTPEVYVRSILNLPDGIPHMEPWMNGAGVNASTFEIGLTRDYFDELVKEHPNLNISNIDITTSSSIYVPHSETMFHAMVNIAPEATHFHFRTRDYINKFQLHNIETFSQSTVPVNEFEFDDVTHSSHKTVMLFGTHNYGIHLEVGEINEVYHGILVGGATYVNDNYHEITCEDFWAKGDEWVPGTPRTQTQVINRLGDKEVPHVVATSQTGGCKKGAVIDLVSKAVGHEGIYSGVSAALPSANGACAAIIGSNPILMKQNPENVKVALMVTAENIDGGYWNPNEDGRDGCGVISAYNACMYAKDVGTAIKTNSSPADHVGISFGTIQRSSGIQKISFNVKAPDVMERGKHLRAVLTWTRDISISDITTIMLSDLNLELREKSSSKLIAQCYSWFDNIEVIDVPNHKIEYGMEYSLDIIVSQLNWTSDSKYNEIKYSIGWVWVDDFGGKLIKHAEISEEENLNLRNRNLEIGEFVTYTPGHKHIITAENVVKLKPGAVINSSSTVNILTAPIIGKYLFRSLGNEVYTFPTIIDRSANFHHIIQVSPSGNISGLSSWNRYNQANESTATFLTQDKNSLELTNIGASFPDIKDKGITISLWVQFLRNNDATGSIVSFLDNTNTSVLRLSVDDVSTYEKELSFYLQDNGNNKTLRYTINEDDLKGINQANDPERNEFNWGWIQLTASWKPGEYMEIFVNKFSRKKEPTNINDISIVKGYLGVEPGTSMNSFSGGIDELDIYKGILTQIQIENGHYHLHTFPFWQGSSRIVNVNCGSHGYVEVKIDDDGHYSNKIDPYAVSASTSREFTFYNGWDIIIDCHPDAGYDSYINGIKQNTLYVTLDGNKTYDITFQ